MNLYEPFAGTASLTWYLLGGIRLAPPCGYMGGKRSLASAIAASAGLSARSPIGRVVLSDAGPWGQFWTECVHPRRARLVAAVLRGWRSEDPRALWNRLVALPPMPDPSERAAQFVWLQARSASCTPVWYEGGEWATQSGTRTKVTGASQCGARWVMPTGSRSGKRREALYAATQKDAVQRDHGRRKDGGCGGVMDTGTVAQRIEAIADVVEARLDRGLPPIEVWHGDLWDCIATLPKDLSDWLCYLDPPYLGATRYAALCPRDRVLLLARELERRRAHVLVSEAEPLSVLGWDAADFTHARRGRRLGKSEWLTSSRPFVHRPAVALSLFGAPC